MGNNIQTLITAIRMLEQELFKRKTIKMANGYVVDTNKGYTLLQASVLPNNNGFRFLLRTFDHPMNSDVSCDLTELIMKDGRVYDETEWVQALMKGVA